MQSQTTSDSDVFAAVDDNVDFARQIEILCELARSQREASRSTTTEAVTDAIDSFKKAFCPDVYVQLQACLAAMLFTSCPFCYDGIARLQFLSEKLIVYATSVDDYGGKNYACSSSIDYRTTVVYRFAEHMWKYDSTHKCDSTHASLALCSIAAHSNILDRAGTEKLDSLRSAVSTVITDRDKTKIDYIDKIICDSLIVKSVVLVCCTMRALVDQSANRDVDWCVLMTKRSSEIGNINKLPERMRSVPLYISAVVRICGGSAALDDFVRTIVTTALAALVSGAYDSKLDANGTRCIMNGRTYCVAELIKEDLLYSKMHQYSREAEDEDKSITLCCMAPPPPTKHDDDADKRRRRQSNPFEALRAIHARKKTIEGALRSRSFARSRKRRMSSQLLVTDEHAKLEVDAGNQDNMPLFGGPIVSGATKETSKRVRSTQSPRQFMCVLLRTVHEVHARRGDTVCVRGPFYRSSDGGNKQFVGAFGCARLTAYLNSMVTRHSMSDMSACPFSAFVRAPVPLGHIYAVAKNRDEPMDADHVDAFLSSCGLTRRAREEAPPREDVARSIMRLAEANADGLFENTYLRDEDQSLPLWMISTDVSGDYRHWPWKLHISSCLGYTPTCYVRTNSHRLSDYKRMRVRYTNRLSMDFGGGKDIFYVNLEEIGYRFVMGEAREYEALIKKIYAYLVYSASVGVSSISHRRLFIVHKGADDATFKLYSTQHMSYSDPRMPVFDMRVRYKVPVQMKNSTSKAQGSIKNQTKLYSRKTYDSKAIRKGRLKEARRHIERTTMPMMKEFVDAYKMSSRIQNCSGESHELRQLELEMAGIKKRVHALSLQMKKPVSVRGAAAHEHMPGSAEHCCLTVPSTSKISFFGIVGSIHYMAARALGLDTDMWGYCPRRLLRMNRYSPDVNNVIPKALPYESAVEWMRSIVEKRPLDHRVFVGVHQSADASRIFTNQDCAGWITRRESMRAMVATFEHWSTSVSDEIAYIREAVDSCEEALYDMRKAYQKTSNFPNGDSNSWRRVVGIIEKLRADDIATRENRANETEQTCAVPRRLANGDYLWDPDTMPDPEWLLHFYLPTIKTAFDANASMFNEILNGRGGKHTRNAWCDALEFTHGKKSIERYVQLLDAVVMRAHKFYWIRTCKNIEDAFAQARRR